jgi:hypothetical protein
MIEGGFVMDRTEQLNDPGGALNERCVSSTARSESGSRGNQHTRLSIGRQFEASGLPCSFLMFAIQYFLISNTIFAGSGM